MLRSCRFFLSARYVPRHVFFEQHCLCGQHIPGNFILMALPVGAGPFISFWPAIVVWICKFVFPVFSDVLLDHVWALNE